jgi:hypothetical protein
LSRGNGACVSKVGPIAAAGIAGLLSAAPAAGAGQQPLPIFRTTASEVSAAVRFLSAYGNVTSTFRSIAHNREVGGVPNSYHLLARAIDLARRPGVTHREIDAALRKAGYNLVESLDERDHSHFAFGPLVAAVSATSAGNPEPPQPPPKPLPRVAADEHGTLAIDLQQGE